MQLTRRTFAAAALTGVAGCIGNGADRIELDGEDVLPVPVLGDPDAEVTVMVFEDFTCGACRQFKSNVFPQIVNTYVAEGEIRYEHRDFPGVTGNPWSWTVAGAARSVQDREGNTDFWVFANEIYGYFGEYSYEAIESVADELDYDAEAIREDAESDVYRDDLEAERERASDAGVEATPTVVVDGEVVTNWPEDTLDAIDAALE